MYSYIYAKYGGVFLLRNIRSGEFLLRILRGVIFLLRNDSMFNQSLNQVPAPPFYLLFLFLRIWILNEVFQQLYFDFWFLISPEFLPLRRWTWFCVMDNCLSWKANNVWLFFKYSSQFSAPKWKMSCSQPELFLQEVFIVKKLLVGWASFFSSFLRCLQ